MKIFIITILINFMLLNVKTFSQSSITFFKYYDYLNSTQKDPIKGIQTDNGRYLTLTNAEYGGPKIGYFFTEFDSLGNHLIDYTYPTGYYYIVMFDFIPFQNGDIFIDGMGIDNSGNDTKFNFLFDKNRNTKWTKGFYSHFINCFFTNDSSIIGISGSYQFINNEWKYLRSFDKFNYNGEIIWSIPFSEYFYNDQSCSETDIFEFNNNYYFFLPYERVTKEKAKLIILSSAGGLIKYDSILKPEVAYDLVKIPGGYIITTVKGNQASLYKLDENLKVKWQYSYSDEHYTSIAKIVTDSFNNIHSLVRHSIIDSASNKVFYEIIKMDTNGKILNSVKFTKPGKDFILNSFYITKDRGYFLLGHWHEVGDNCLGLIIKTDSNGYINDTNLIYLSDPVKPNVSKTISTYPNPFITSCTFQIPPENERNYRFLLHSLTGQLLKEQEFNSNTYRLNRDGLPGGMYFYTIKTQKNVYSGKLVINP
jgi:hypothetical protein